MTSRRQLLRRHARWLRYVRRYRSVGLVPYGEGQALFRLAVHSIKHRPQDWHETVRPE